ncbi:hypothetical protein HanIR_Chr02g0072331 [Helianthus annuus]|nr:hypothetical protein HanIR_Chr02g0072331 [Helianthus annuus]
MTAAFRHVNNIGPNRPLLCWWVFHHHSSSGRWGPLTLWLSNNNSSRFFSIYRIELVEIRACFRIFRSLLVAFLDFLVVFVNVLPFLFATFCIPVVSVVPHRGRYLLP